MLNCSNTGKMNSEKQFNRKVEYNKELRKLFEEMEKIKNE